ncbi:COP23 domain-containing protein [Acaryochloris sp. IP29b_bin.148]|uniref:COP23 domain-containing protein n=1 Tax=Acaryochloris sp. IP29b_bin.148 TaxID=2969218 RepID=UPI0026157F32|nr:COP23 domain-containing protein [Acaryochloris sp. IP29b_bin.148]
MATLRVNQSALPQALRLVVQSSLGVAIALLSTAQSPSLAQDSLEDDFPDVEPSERIDPDDPDVRDNPNPDDPADISSSTRFFCQYTGGQYTVMYNPKSRPNEAFPWAVPAEMGGGWTPELRCQEIARRLEEYRPDGLLELQTGTENGYNTVCATSEADSNCRIVFTVPRGQDPTTTRNAVFDNLTVANSGEMTQGVNTFVGNDRNTPLNIGNGRQDSLGQIVNLGKTLFGKRSRSLSRTPLRAGMNLRPHLDPADGGTGKALRKGVSITKQHNRSRSKGLKLQPDQFR